MKKLSKTNVNNMKKGAVAIALVASLGLAGLSAYFTDHQSAQNTFTVGSVKQTLTEPSWDETKEPGKNMVPNQVFAKDPTITNVGENDQYVFMKVEVPAANVTTLNEDGTKGTTTSQELFTYKINGDWKELVDKKKTTATSVTHVYYYGTDAGLTKLAKNQKTTLFTSVQFKNIVEGEVEGEKKININSYGIQSENLNLTETTPANVWKLLESQSK